MPSETTTRPASSDVARDLVDMLIFLAAVKDDGEIHVLDGVYATVSDP
jgi:hypothetical protein